LICGNRKGEELVFDKLYKGTEAENFITFAGYRDDISELMPGCYAGVIASTGWDSFPRSSLEMAAAGLPLLVSDLAGINETVEHGVTGLLFKPGDHIDLADKLTYLLSKPDAREQLSNASVKRVHENFTLDIQKHNLRRVIESVVKS
jgi:glycosyltransferase involved in cell wall biosynthesis